MPEPPDFAQIARRLDNEIRALIPSQESDQSVDHIAEQLRQVWNARGAADITQIEAAYEAASESGYRSLTELHTTIRSLDR